MSARENPYAPWKLPVIGPLWVIQITIPVAYFIGVPIVATSKPGWHAGMDVWYVNPVPRFLPAGREYPSNAQLILSQGRHHHGIIIIRDRD